MQFFLRLQKLLTAPPSGFEIKGKYVVEHEITSSTNDSTPVAPTQPDLSEEGMQTWQKFFASGSNADAGIQVHVNWVMFLSNAHLSPEKFDWAKNLTSSIWKIILEGSDSKEYLIFYLTDKCPTLMAPVCIQESNYLDKESSDTISTPKGSPTTQGIQGQTASSTSAIHLKGKRKDRTPIVKSEVRRSLRLQHINNGFNKKGAKIRTVWPVMLNHQCSRAK